jgi:CRISPR-associated protein Csb2
MLKAALDRLASPDAQESDIVLRLGRFGTLRLRLVAAAEASEHKSLHPARYLAAHRIWSTVTPIALDRHTKSDDPRQEAAAIVAESCTRIGLPEPRRVYVHKHAAISGAPSARPPGGAPRWTGWARPGSLAHRQVTHATLHFEEPVAGPVILGAGRFFGLGLCLPVAERARP